MVNGLDVLRRPICERLSTYDSLDGCVISDKDGVTVLQVSKEGKQLKLDALMRHPFLSSYGVSNDHADKIDSGRNSMTVVSFEHLTVAHFNHAPLHLTIFGGDGCRTGDMMTVSRALEPLIMDIAEVVLEQ